MKVDYSNPLTGGWYADPEIREYNGKFYIYVTQSFSDYSLQKNIDCFVTTDFKHFDLKRNIIVMEEFPEFENACWAPTEIEVDGYHYLVFSINDIKNDNQAGGLVIARSKNPEGPYKRFTENLLIETFINGAQPIDAHLFKDTNDEVFLLYGGWGHLNICKMNDSMENVIEDSINEIIVPDYVEAPCMMKKNNKYYLMYSTGGWTNSTYSVIITEADNINGKYENPKKILSSSEIAVGPGHNSYITVGDSTYIVYHRRYADDLEAGDRYLAMDELMFVNDIPQPVIMT